MKTNRQTIYLCLRTDQVLRRLAVEEVCANNHGPERVTEQHSQCIIQHCVPGEVANDDCLNFHHTYCALLFQIICRCVTFGINAYILRHVGHEALGVMNVRLLLLESTLIFLSREAISRSALSAISLQRNKCTWRQLVNQMWIT